MNSGRTLFFIIILIIFGYPNIYCFAGETECSTEGISIIQQTGSEIILQYKDQIRSTNNFSFHSAKKLYGPQGINLIFLEFDSGGSCGHEASIVTVCNEKLIYQNMEKEPCGRWEIISNRIVFWQTWKNICGSGWCNHCGPQYPSIFTIKDFVDGKIIVQRSKSLREIYSVKETRKLIEEIRKNLSRTVQPKDLRSINNSMEKALCINAMKNKSRKTIHMLLDLDFSIGDRTYFFR